MGGYCIGVDFYYLSYFVMKFGKIFYVILVGCEINDVMVEWVVVEVFGKYVF